MVQLNKFLLHGGMYKRRDKMNRPLPIISYLRCNCIIVLLISFLGFIYENSLRFTLISH